MKILASRNWRAAAVATVAVPALATSQLTAALVSQLGITKEFAVALIFALSNGGAVAAVAMYPPLAPFLATVRAMQWTFGTAAIVSF